MAIDVAKYQQMVEDSTPGKFEGESPATAYYYEAYMDGDPGEEIGQWSIYTPSDEERQAFDLTDVFFGILFRDDGFIMGQELTARMYDTIVADEEEAEEDEDA